MEVRQARLSGRLPDLEPVLDALISGLQETLRDQLLAIYLQGSLAVGDADEHSDVDFVVVIRDELTQDEVERLQVMHRELYDFRSPWAKHLEGSYFPASVIRTLDGRDRPLWYLDNGSRHLILSKHCNTAVVRWVVLNEGIPLHGPEASGFIEPVEATALRSEIIETMTTWGQEIIDRPACIDNVFYQTFAVLSYCRMLHDLQVRSINSKRVGAAWAKQNLDARWHDLIDRAWLGRPNPEITSQTPADPEDLHLTVAFVVESLAKAKTLAGKS